ncbi:MAG: hypothetical protein EWV52_16770 [Microcystis panniformis Mp_MB_F_20051200_S6D]|nr:MAG: hypothetical protein EWV52_16770 [Microcystis panniformis Mp_MB_F_20051200_S6D]
MTIGWNMSKMWLPLLAAILSSIGQILLKLAMNRHGEIAFNVSGILRLLLEPVLLVALMLYASTLLMWLYILSKYPLSVAYPMLAATYVLVPLMSIYFFGDRIGDLQIIGIATIIIGLFIFGQGR